MLSASFQGYVRAYCFVIVPRRLPSFHRL